MYPLPNSQASEQPLVIFKLYSDTRPSYLSCSWILDDEAVEALVEGSRVTLGIVSFYYADPAQACPVQRLMPDI